jgi:hypothetical protein
MEFKAGKLYMDNKGKSKSLTVSDNRNILQQADAHIGLYKPYCKEL